MRTTEDREDGDARQITLYRLHGCPYCERVVRRLERYGLAYRSVFVPGEHSRRNAVARVAGTRSVPLLVDEGTGVTMPESGRIVEYLDRSYGDEEVEEGDSTFPFEVVPFPPSKHPQEGETAPEFTRPLVTTEGWEDRSLSELVAESGSVLLFFTPLDWGGKSLYWWREVGRRGWGGDDLAVVGVAIGQPFDHQRFVESRERPYPLFSDPANGVAEAYDVVHDLDGMTGVSEPRPAVFVVGEDREVEYAWVAGEWPEVPPFDEIATAIES
ncbi:redoxin domain-containing protein [Natronorarus salvus]|uniref:redoxin domain-containing protein n=1 Tax=Natronorarus salvus TaxID=3117733 RepID=UPI0039082773